MYSSVHNPDGSEFLTRFVVRGSIDKQWGGRRQLIGEARVVSLNPKKQAQLLSKELSECPKGSQILFYGDDLRSFDINRIGDTVGIDAVRLSPAIHRSLPEMQGRIIELSSRSLENETTMLVNGIPADMTAVQAMGPFVASPRAWLDLHNAVENAAADRFTNRISDKDSFLEELQTGDHDVVYVIAHSDGLNLYVGSDRVSLDDLRQLPKRVNRSPRPRVAVLAICNAGQITGSARSRILALFQKQSASLAETLIDHGFFDQVIAPDHVIGDKEGTEALIRGLHGRPLAEIRGVFRNWNKLATVISEQLRAQI